MADNYLEKRMEDLRSGRLSASSHSGTSRSTKGWLRVRFPERRVLIINFGDRATALSAARSFIDASCRVSVSDCSAETDFPSLDGGIRLYDHPADIRPVVSELTSAWRDIDIVVISGKPDKRLHDLLDEWIEFKSTHPSTGDYGGRLIVTGESDTEETAIEIKSEFGDSLSDHRIRVYAVQGAPDQTARAALLLCAPAFSDVITSC